MKPKKEKGHVTALELLQTVCGVVLVGGAIWLHSGSKLLGALLKNASFAYGFTGVMIVCLFTYLPALLYGTTPDHIKKPGEVRP